MITHESRICKGPGCTNPLPPPRPGRKAKLACSPTCRKAASRAHLRDEARRRGEEARRQRLARWQIFQSATRRCLEQVEALGGAGLAEQVAEAIRSEMQASR